MKINVGIVGYGNLGKAAEHEILKNKQFKLVAIFSRRVVKSKYGTIIEPYENHLLYKNKIDIMLLCGSSIYDLEEQTSEIAKNFNIINSFDTHQKIKTEKDKLDKICKANKTISIISCGWDPGLFSMIRGLFYAISKNEPTTFWGKGISMGHSDAIRHVNGIDDGIQFTVPNKQAIKLAKQGKLTTQTPKHFRECFVVSHDTNHKKIETEIKQIPNYFSGQPTTVCFLTQKELNKMKVNMAHKGEIISLFNDTQNHTHAMNFSVKMKSNPYFTSKIMIAYISAISKLKNLANFGCFTPLDIPISWLYYESEKYILNNLC